MLGPQKRSSPLQRILIRRCHRTVFSFQTPMWIPSRADSTFRFCVSATPIRTLFVSWFPTTPAKRSASLALTLQERPTPTLLPVTQPGELTDCRSGGVRLTIQDPASIQAGRFRLRSFMNATRLTLQPAFAASNGRLYLAWSNSRSLIFGAPNSNSNIMFMRSADGGNTWSAPVQVNPTVSTDTHHVLPALSLGPDGKSAHVA